MKLPFHISNKDDDFLHFSNFARFFGKFKFRACKFKFRACFCLHYKNHKTGDLRQFWFESRTLKMRTKQDLSQQPNGHHPTVMPNQFKEQSDSAISGRNRRNFLRFLHFQISRVEKMQKFFCIFLHFFLQKIIVLG